MNGVADKIMKALGIIISVIVSVVVVWIGTRAKLLPCDVYKKEFFEKQTNLIVTDRGQAGREILLEGLNPETHVKVTYYDEGGFYLPLKDSLEIGDTLGCTDNYLCVRDQSG